MIFFYILAKFSIINKVRKQGAKHFAADIKAFILVLSRNNAHTGQFIFHMTIHKFRFLLSLQTDYNMTSSVCAIICSPQSLWSYLWCQIFWCSTEGFHRGTICDPLFTQPKVCNLYVAVLV